MPVTVSQSVAAKLTHADFPIASIASQVERGKDLPIVLSTGELSVEALRELREIADGAGDKSLRRTVDALIDGRSGDFSKPVPKFQGFEDTLRSYIETKAKDGWIYFRDVDGHLYPELVTDVQFDTGIGYNRKEDPQVIITTYYRRWRLDDKEPKLTLVKSSHSFTPADVARRYVSDILENASVYVGTDALRADYDATMEHYEERVQLGFAKQFRYSGKPISFENHRSERHGLQLHNRKVINDTMVKSIAVGRDVMETNLGRGTGADEGGFGHVPEHPLVRIFDLGLHDFAWVNARDMVPYVYDKNLADKLILPPSHRELLDVLTNEDTAFTIDIIEGKTAGNIIFCTGAPGVGKTLTAEVYSEMTERPLYRIHAGSLGTTASQIQERLERAFARATRWNCIILLDEADVFVMRRGINLELNAITAEFLRILEYVPNLMFMTSNRPDDVDDAIRQRFLAIINYEVPTADLALPVWKIMATLYGAKLADDDFAALVRIFPNISQRNIRQLTSMTMRNVTAKKRPLSVAEFVRYAAFRGINADNDVIKELLPRQESA